MSSRFPLFDEPQTDTAVHRDYLGISGLSYRPNFLSRSEQESLLHSIDHLPWRNDLSRRVQHYGYKYDYKSRRIDESLRVGPLPEFANEVGLRLVNEKLIAEIPDQVIVNEYEPGQGISMHIDCEPCFRDTIVTISLGSVYIMDFHDTQSERIEEVPLELGSALVLSGEARYRWRHGIKSRKVDHGRQRGRRVSLTFRNVILSDAKLKPAKQKPAPKQTVVTTDYLRSLDVAALQFKLSVQVNAAAHNGTLPQKCVGMVFGQLSLGKDDLVLNSDEATIGSSALQHSATYLLAVSIDTALEQLISNRFNLNEQDQDIVVAARVARFLRNAFTHNPFNPRWKIDNANNTGRFEIPDVISIDASNLNGVEVEWQHYGGPLALLRFLRYCQQLLANVKTT